MEKTTNESTLIRVGVVDDHITVTSGIAVMLNQMKGIRSILEAYNGEHLLEILSSGTELPDILLMDINMAPMNGIEATRQVSQLYPGIKVIALTSNRDEWSMRQMIAAGACNFLLKITSPLHMEEAIRKVYKYGRYHVDLNYLYGQGFTLHENAMVSDSFTDKDIQYLRLLCQGCSNREIAEEMKITQRTITYYRERLAEKLDKTSIIDMSFEALRLGLVELYHSKKK